MVYHVTVSVSMVTNLVLSILLSYCSYEGGDSVAITTITVTYIFSTTETIPEEIKLKTSHLYSCRSNVSYGFYGTVSSQLLTRRRVVAILRISEDSGVYCGYNRRNRGGFYGVQKICGRSMVTDYRGYISVSTGGRIDLIVVSRGILIVFMVGL